MPKVLVADDSEMMRKIAKMSITKAGHLVFEAANGIEAVDSALQNLPDIILLDAEMPEMDGWEACKNIRKNPQTAKIPVVMCTGNDLSEEKELLTEAGANDYITKPYNQVLLIEKISKLLG
ncbi:MAG: response regulator [Elusimicrobia bacterium]|nr:response regulator [Candidatus Liberimonas magnetica]